MKTFIKNYPAVALCVLAMLFAFMPVLAVQMGLLPQWATQLSASSSSLAGIVLAAIEGRKHGVRELLGRLLIWRVGIQWWAFALFFPIVPVVVGLYLFNLLGGPAVDWNKLRSIYNIVPMFIITTILAGLGEELGWRGFALPRLQAHHSALTSGLIVGVAWGIWHIPLFLINGTIQYQWHMQAGLITAVLAYTAYVIAESLQATWVFNNTKGSVLIAVFMHGALNTWNQYIDVYRGQFGGIITYMVVMVSISIIVVLFAGAKNLSRTNDRNMLGDDQSAAGLTTRE